MGKSKRLAHVAKDCVACGACTKACRVKAIAVDRGLRARVDADACVGCGLCSKACPADVIMIHERGAAQTSAEAVGE